jgi:Ca2+-binding EF-hand superfamily protein
MTPGDFVRFITPNHNIHGLIVKSDGSVNETNSVKETLWDIFKSIDQNADGLISYTEFMFFTTLLAIPPKYFCIAFRLFDEDGNGKVDKSEFKNIMTMVQCANPLTKISSSP